MHQVAANTKALAAALMAKGFHLATGGSDNHIILLNVREFGLSGAQAELVLEYANVSVNKNTIAGDVSALNPSGIRIGLPAMTTRGLVEADMDWVASVIERCLSYGALIANLSTDAFRESAMNSDIVGAIRDEVRVRCRALPAPASLTY